MRKTLDVRKLVQLLQTLPEGCRVEVNQVGNLRISSPTDEYLGFVDFMTGEMNVHDEASERA